MIDCTGETVQIRIGAVSSAGQDVEFVASGTVISQQGFRSVYRENNSVGSEAGGESDQQLPMLLRGDRLNASKLDLEEYATKPPARYTEASLIKQLEKLGVGRPSTYASIVQTIINRGYVWKRSQALVPSFIAFAVVKLLEGHFPKMVDYDFTAQMELDLDSISRGDMELQPWLSRFYFGCDDDPGLKEKVSNRLGDIDARSVNTIPLGVAPTDGTSVEVRVGSYGPYLLHGDNKASLPDDTVPDELTLERALKLLSTTGDDKRLLGFDPGSGCEVMVRNGRFGPYVQMVSPEEQVDTREVSGRGKKSRSTKKKPKAASLLKSMTLDSVTLEEALKLLSLPRVVGVDPIDDVDITVNNGRYGPYLQKGTETRSLASEDQLFTVTVEECLELLAQPGRRGGRRTFSPKTLRELGEDPETGKKVELRDGRFGPYVADGDTNASLRAGDSVDGLTLERASELLAERRAKGPSERKRPRRKKVAAGKSKKVSVSAGKKVAAGKSKKASRSKSKKVSAGKKVAAGKSKKASRSKSKKASR